MKKPLLVLASTSPYRRELLARLGIPFETIAPTTHETPLPGEAPRDLVRRLARAKAESVAPDYPDALIIGSDQVAILDGKTLGKPGNAAANRRQLEDASGKQVEFLTGLCLLNTRTHDATVDVIPFPVRFRPLSSQWIENYVAREKPFDCAGGFKSEGLGIALFEGMSGEDPTALMGLPLIRLTDMLNAQGVDVLGAAEATN